MKTNLNKKLIPFFLKDLKKQIHGFLVYFYFLNNFSCCGFKNSVFLCTAAPSLLLFCAPE